MPENLPFLPEEDSLPDLGLKQVEKTIARPPLDEWIKSYFTEKKEDKAIHLIRRVTQLHLSEGIRLIVKFLPEFSEYYGEAVEPPKVLRWIGLEHLLSWHRDFFSYLKNELGEYIGGGTVKSYEPALMHGYLQSALQIVPVGSKEKKLGSDQNIQESQYTEQEKNNPELLAQIQRIDEYYAQFVTKKFTYFPYEYFPKKEPFKGPAWVGNVLDLAERIALLRNGNLPTLENLDITLTLEELEQEFGEGWVYRSFTELLEAYQGVSEVEKDKPETNKNEKLVHTYNLKDVLPEGAQAIKPISATPRGLVVEYKLGGQAFTWFEGKLYDITDVNNQRIVVTRKHFCISGKRGSANVCIIDGEEFYGRLSDYKIRGDNLIVFNKGFGSDRETQRIGVWVNGKFFPGNIPEEEVYGAEFLGDGSLAVLFFKVNDRELDTVAYVVDIETLELSVEKIVGEQEKFIDVIELGYSFYFVSQYKEILWKTRLYDVARDRKIESYNRSFISTPSLANAGSDENRVHDFDDYSVFELGQGKFLAYCPNLTSSRQRFFPLIKHGEAFYGSFDSLFYEKYELHNPDAGSKQYMRTGIVGNQNLDAALYDDTYYLTPVIKDTSEQFGASFLNYTSLHLSVIRSLYDTDGYALYTAFPQQVGHPAELFQTYISEGEAKLQSICFSEDEEYFYIEEKLKSGTIERVYKVGPVAITDDEVMNLLMLGAVKSERHKPLVLAVLKPDATGMFKVYVGERVVGEHIGVSPIIGYGKKYGRSQAGSIAFFDRGTFEVTEYDRYFTDTNEPWETNSVEYKALKLAELFFQYQQLHRQLKNIRMGFEDFDDTTVSEEVMLARMKGIIDEVRQILEFEKRTLYIVGENFLKRTLKHFSPAQIVNYQQPTLDDNSETFYQQMRDILLPEIKEHNEREREKFERILKDFIASRKELNGYGDLTASATPLPTGPVTGLVDEGIRAAGGNAENNFAVGETIGKIDLLPSAGLLNSLLYQTHTGWNRVELPITQSSIETGAILYNSVQYLQPQQKEYGGEVLLCIPPHTVISPESLYCVVAGQNTPLQVEYKKGYPIVTVPANTEEVHFKVAKVRQEIESCSWEKYEKFKETLKKNKPELFEGLSKVLPIDSRLELKIDAFDKAIPIEYLSEMEKLCRVSGHYDFDNKDTAKERSNMDAFQALTFAQTRATSLKITGESKGVGEEQFYAGVCYESALLLIAMLRKRGILAGITAEFRPKEDGTYSEFNMHSSVFALWPAENELGYEPVYVDGTFINSLHPADVPATTTSLQEAIEGGEVTVDELSLEGAIKPAHRATEYKPLPEKIIQPRDEKEVSLLDELESHDHDTLSRLYEVLLLALYGPKLPETEGFRQAKTTEEKWQWVLDTSEENKALYMNSFAEYSSTQLINGVILELRKLGGRGTV